MMSRIRKTILCLLTVLCLIACSAAEAEKPMNKTTVKMPQVIGNTMSAALDQLKAIGFQDVRTEKSDKSSDDSEFVVTDQSIEAGTDTDLAETIILTCQRLFDLAISITSDDNLLFSKYGLDILLDNEKLGTVANGETFEKKIRILEGKHELTICKEGEEKPSDTYQLNLKSDSELICTATHGSSSVSIRNPKITETEEEVIARTVTQPEETETEKEPEPTPTPVPEPSPTPEITPSEEAASSESAEPSVIPETEPSEEAVITPEESPQSEETPLPEETANPEETIDPEQTAEPEQSEESEPLTEEEVQAEPVPEPVIEETPEPEPTPRPFSTAYKDAEKYKNGRAGSYVFKVPDTWVKGDKRFDLAENKKGAYFTYGQGEGEGVTAYSIPKLLEEYQAQFVFEEILEQGRSYYFDGNKTYYVKAVEKVSEKKKVIHEIYMFADQLFKKPVIFNFIQPVNSELDYSEDFRSVMSSIRDYTYTVKDVVTKDYKVTYETDVLEYSNKEIDLTTLVSTKKKGVVFTTDDKVDLSKLGEYTVTYTVTRGLISATEEHTFTVKDTKKPKIKIESKEVKIKYDKDYDPFKNIVSVKDPVDGALELVEEDPGEPLDGWYYLDGPKYFDSPGQYKFTVYACDKHGNKTKKSFTVTRKNPPAPKYDYIYNRNTGVFHYDWCRAVKLMKEKNKVYYNNVTRSTMTKKGYDPCDICNP